MISLSLSHISYKSHGMIIVTVMQSHIIKNIEGSRIIMLYYMSTSYNIHDF